MRDLVLKKNSLLENEEVEGNYVFLDGEEVTVLHCFEKDLYDLFDGTQSVQEISQKISNKYTNYLEKDFFEFVKSLIDLKLLIVSEE